MERRGWLTAHAEIMSELRSTGRVFVDTNTVHANKLIKLADLINRWNDHCPQPSPAQVIVSTLVYAERQAQERRKRAERFDRVKVRQFLAAKKVWVAPFTLADAEDTSEFLYKRAPTDEAWSALKLDKMAQALGVERDKLPKRISATSDWLIAGHAWACGGLTVTDDRGAEFAYMPRRVRYATLTQALNDELPDPF